MKDKAQVKDNDPIVNQNLIKPINKATFNEPKPQDNPISEGLNNKSRKIKKIGFQTQKKILDTKAAKKAARSERLKKAKEKLKFDKIPIKKEIQALESISDFVKLSTAKYRKIRARTIQKLPLDKNLIKRTTKALLKHYEIAKESNNNSYHHGVNNDDFIYLEIVLNQVPPKYTIKPIQIELPIAIYGPEYHSRFCLITSETQKKLKDKLAELNLPCITRVMLIRIEVIDYKSLTKNYLQQPKEQKKLFNEHDLFLCEAKLYNMFNKSSGKIFFQKKKIPFPIDCERIPENLQMKFKSYEKYLNSLGNYTYFSMGNGPIYMVKVARTTMIVKQIVKNIIHGVYNTVPHILRQSLKHSTIKQISIKTIDSISLPIFTQSNEEDKKGK